MRKIGIQKILGPFKFRSFPSPLPPPPCSLFKIANASSTNHVASELRVISRLPTSRFHIDQTFDAFFTLSSATWTKSCNLNSLNSTFRSVSFVSDQSHRGQCTSNKVNAFYNKAKKSYRCDLFRYKMI